MRFAAVGVFLLLAAPAQADCVAPGVTFLSCVTEKPGKRLDVCIEGGDATYAYGPAGAPELRLVASVNKVEYRPWNGIGRTIWEEVVFSNRGYRYAVYGGIDRRHEDDRITPVPFGGVVIYRGEDEVAEIACAGDVVFPWGQALSNARQAAGLRRDHEAQRLIAVDH